MSIVTNEMSSFLSRATFSANWKPIYCNHYKCWFPLGEKFLWKTTRRHFIGWKWRHEIRDVIFIQWKVFLLFSRDNFHHVLIFEFNIRQFAELLLKSFPRFRVNLRHCMFEIDIYVNFNQMQCFKFTRERACAISFPGLLAFAIYKVKNPWEWGCFILINAWKRSYVFIPSNVSE